MNLKGKIICAIALCGVVSVSLAKKPNIVLIMADDMGYECVGANGSEDYLTPVIDDLAAEGLRFEQCFANPICTPSRVKIMTGIYNARNYVSFGKLDRSQTTFAHLLKEAGYATAIAGKWQLGSEVDSPQHFGFDEACLWQHTRGRKRKGGFDTRYANPQLEINGKEVDYLNGEYGPDICADFICSFIETNKDKPFFAYYPMILTHWPFDATPDSDDWDPKYMGSTTNKGPGDETDQKRHFKDMVQYMDKLVGRIADALDRAGVRENTLVIIAGDNGTDKPIITQWNDREVVGRKSETVDEGTRVTMVMSWPGVLQPRVDKTELVEFSDILPTLCDLAGAALPKNYPGDGQSLTPVMFGKGERHKKYVCLKYRTTWVRNLNYGILPDKGNSQYIFQKYNGHYESEDLDFANMTEKERMIFEELKPVLDGLKKSVAEKKPKKTKKKKKDA
ncbi:sulfatase-like hydrolase/transferase [Pontiella sulfatireligans]|uniref:Arylsulfatase n=1 Tax=Pontiella sulfatireligans TaxID=2750658 RepID=A0A6C2UFK4_9BACT|nr:sulfatase-like hydrolase/transferase [Pontiella sulfatireligans]SPS74265.1 sulfatase S1_24 [Kiritimatiellales bacterium]VGO18925.1 Arylsulfatase [Pontiella sulfatireligans]